MRLYNRSRRFAQLETSVERIVSEFLIDYYVRQGRYYSWRKNRTPFSVYLSETLLQRTRADQVQPVYDQLMDRHGNLLLLKRNYEEVVSLLKPLGRNCRLEPFRQGINYLCSEHKGIIPEEKKQLLKVPGIGEYISAAIRIFGYEKRDVIIDANIVRLIGRIKGIDFNAETRRKKSFLLITEKFVPQKQYIEYSYGALDYAAAVCKPMKPACYACGIRIYCVHYCEKLN
jgi:A/G-specific adenine glycosylase